MDNKHLLAQSFIFSCVFICLAVLYAMVMPCWITYIIIGATMAWAIVSAVLLWKELRNERGR